MTAATYSAYVPCYNNAATLRRAVESVLAQTVRPVAVLVIDDGSTDDSAATLADLPVRVVRQERNLGRGAARARALQELGGEFVLCCDATNALRPDFAATVAHWFADGRVAAVHGRWMQPPGGGAVQRWRGRHLFKLAHTAVVQRGGLHATHGAMVRVRAVQAVGGYDARLRHSEDADLGVRLRRAGHDVISDPAAEVMSLSRNSLGEVLERYWRWNAGTDEGVTWSHYGRDCAYAFKVMAAADLRERDFAAALISLGCPHYRFWRSWFRGAGRRVQQD